MNTSQPIVCVIKFNNALPKQYHFHFRENNLFVWSSNQAKQMVSRLKGVNGKQFLHRHINFTLTFPEGKLEINIKQSCYFLYINILIPVR